MAAVMTARERARREITAEILAAARRQLGEQGAAALSVRAVARELGLASSAVYRYVATRDELLTALVVEAYDSIGAAVEEAGAPGEGRGPRERWTAACRAVRTWARQHPHEYALVYGSPVPGYAAPTTTVAPAARVPLALLATLEGVPSPAAAPLSAELDAQVRELAVAQHLDLAPELLVRAVGAWTALFGLVGFELSGQLVGSFTPADALFERTVEDLADHLGL